MNRACSLLLVLTMLLTLCSCAKQDEAPTPGSTEAPVVSETEAPGFIKLENYATMLTVTINPKLCLYLDAAGKVLAVAAANEDAQAIVDSISFENDTYEAAIEKIVTASSEKGYIKADAVIHVEITKVKDPSVNAADILSKATDTVNHTAAKLEITVQVQCENKSPIDEPSTETPTVTPTEPATPTDPAPTDPTAPTTPPATNPQQCVHTYETATCTAPKTCSKCGATEGSAAGHNWKAATCTTPKTCSKCNATEGKAAGHGWKDATCTAPKTCSKCNATEGSAIGHSWKDATCTAPKTCSKCGATEGEALAHSYQNGVCSCGTRQLGIGSWKTYRLSGDTLYVISIGAYGISELLYVDTESVYFETVKESISKDSPEIVYQGKTYVNWTGSGNPMHFDDIEENSITAHLDAHSDNSRDKFTLQRKSKDQLVVTSVVGCDWPGITVGMIFTYAE